MFRHLSRLLQTASGQSVVVRDVRSRLRIELLESRDNPSAYFVTNLNDSGEGSLREAILDANSDPSLVADIYFSGLDNDDVLALESALPMLSTVNITIHGPTIGEGDGFTITCNDVSGASVISIVPSSPQTYTINNLRFLSCSADSGGVINAPAELVLNNCKFLECTGWQGGGAIWSSSHLELNSCTFIFNNAATGNGGAIYHSSATSICILEITDCYFSGNWTDGGNGGTIFANFAEGRLVLNNTTIIGGQARDGNGGGIYQISGGFYMYGGVITGCSSISGSAATSPDGAGGIELHNIRIPHSIVIHGAVYNNFTEFGLEPNVLIADSMVAPDIGPGVASYLIVP